MKTMTYLLLLTVLSVFLFLTASNVLNTNDEGIAFLLSVITAHFLIGKMNGVIDVVDNFIDVINKDMREK
ncbi:hypothetical protein LCL95_01435 [Bacillus timonensis]|nr:hypothetical protein [Bacillus timonensis]